MAKSECKKCGCPCACAAGKKAAPRRKKTSGGRRVAPNVPLVNIFPQMVTPEGTIPPLLPSFRGVHRGVTSEHYPPRREDMAIATEAAVARAPAAGYPQRPPIEGNPLAQAWRDTADNIIEQRDALRRQLEQLRAAAPAARETRETGVGTEGYPAERVRLAALAAGAGEERMRQQEIRRQEATAREAAMAAERGALQALARGAQESLEAERRRTVPFGREQTQMTMQQLAERISQGRTLTDRPQTYARRGGGGGGGAAGGAPAEEDDE